MLKVLVTGLIGCLASTCLVGNAIADRQEDQLIALQIEASLEVATDHTITADDPDLKLTNTEQTLDVESELSFGDSISIFSLLTLDSVRDPKPGKSRFLKANGLHLDSLYLQLQHANVKFFAGKYDVAFAVAWDQAFGIYGTDLAEDYEIEKMIAIGGEVVFETVNWGKHILTGSVFFADTTVFSDSLFTSAGRLRAADGGLANTNSFSSFAVNMGGDFVILPGNVAYNFGVSVQDGGSGAPNHEVATAFALLQEREGPAGTNLEWLAEVAFLANAEGNSSDRLYTTFSAKVGWDKFWFAPSVTHRLDNIGRANNHSILATASIGMDITEQFNIAAGYAYLDEDGGAQHVIGLKSEFTFGN